MSSSQQSTNSNNNQSQTSSNTGLDDYELDPSMQSMSGLNISAQTTSATTNNNQEQTDEDYVNDDPQYDQDEVNDLLKNLPSLPVDFPYENDVNDEFENDQYQQFYTSYEDDPVYSDDVQDAFAQYEQEYSKYWNNNPSEDDVFDEMDECLQYMSREYAAAHMPEDLVDRAQNSTLNPDANEFCPPGFNSFIPAENQTISMIPCVFDLPAENAENLQ